MSWFLIEAGSNYQVLRSAMSTGSLRRAANEPRARQSAMEGKTRRPVELFTALQGHQPATPGTFDAGLFSPILVFLLIWLLLPLVCRAARTDDSSRFVVHLSPVPPPNFETTSGVPGENALNACMLLSKAEIEAVQGEPVKDVKEAKNSPGKGGSLLISQCFFVLATSANSISVALTVPGSSRLEALQLWQKQFHGSAASEKERDGSEGDGRSSRDREKRKLLRPLAVSSLGEEAYWVRNRFGGTLYVLKRAAFFRISIGGMQDDSLRLKKAQTLAKDALGRMP